MMEAVKQRDNRFRASLSLSQSHFGLVSLPSVPSPSDGSTPFHGLIASSIRP